MAEWPKLTGSGQRRFRIREEATPSGASDLQLIPDPDVDDFSIPGVTANIGSCEQVINTPIDRVFEIICELPVRLNWRDGAKEVQLLNDKLNRIGTKHRRLIDSNSPCLSPAASRAPPIRPPSPKRM